MAKSEGTPLPLHYSAPSAPTSQQHQQPHSQPQPQRERDGPERERRLTFQRDDARSSWLDRFMDRMRTWVQPSTGSPSDGLGKESDSGASFSTFLHSQAQLDREREDQDWVLDEVVVTGEEDHKHGSDRGTNGTRQSESEHNGSLHRGRAGGHIYEDEPDISTPWGYVRYVLLPNIAFFFEPAFEDGHQETEYRKQVWYSTKRLAFFASLFMWLNWIMYLVLNRSVTTFEKIAYYGGLTVVTLPLPFMVAYDMPSKHGFLFQIWFTVAMWYCGFLEIIEMRQCNFFDVIPGRENPQITYRRLCGDRKDFLAMLYYTTAIPALGMLVVIHRAFSGAAVTTAFVLLSTLVLTVEQMFVRNVIGFLLFWAFMFYLHYSREMIERRMYMLNAQLKIAYRGQQKAQIAESKASHAKRRFASYIFHEVRVPLNTAMLAYQNLQLNGAFKDDSVESQSIEIHALEASLFMMQQVLNDVLDLERMDSGRFESNPRPFPLHRAIESIMGPVRMASDAKRLTLRTELDRKIDDLAPKDVLDGLWVVGDEIRLRQILTNLASNAVKFTPDGSGEIAVLSKLLEYTVIRRPHMGTTTSDATRGGSQEKLEGPGSGSGNGSNEKDSGGSVPCVRFRLEVHDSGPGIRPSDLVEHRLFQPFVQTAVGKSSGKGTGLGLAIVRQIVSLSGGRLGVQSRRGAGACFWVELSYPVASEHEIGLARTSTPDRHQQPPTPPLARHAGAGVKQVGRPSKSDRDRMGLESYADPNHNPLAFNVPHAANSPSPPTATEQASTFEIRNSPAPILASSAPSALPVGGGGRGGAGGMTLADPPGVLSPPDNPLRVLCVDDDEMTRTLMTRMLQKQGCVVETASDGQEFLDVLLKQSRRFDLVTLDNFMPNVSGEEAIRTLREEGRDDFVVGCTGNALTEDQMSYLDAGVDRILTKPIHLKDLKLALQAALGRRNAAPSAVPTPSAEQ